MGTVTGLTAEAMQAIVDGTIVDATVNELGDLIFTKHDNTSINAGHVEGAPGVPGTNGTNVYAGSPWNPATTYQIGDVAGYGGQLWKCVKTNSINDCPMFVSSAWVPLTYCDSDWVQPDPYFMCDSVLLNWQMFWQIGAPGISMTSVAGEYETGYQALKLSMPISSMQLMYQFGENVVNGGDIIKTKVRAKMLAGGPAGGSTLNVGLFQSGIGSVPEPYAPDAAEIFAQDPGTEAVLTTEWATYEFFNVAVNDRPRALVNIHVNQSAAGTATVLIDRIEVERIQGASRLLMGTELLGGVDLDDIRNPGIYTQSHSTEAASGTNYPEALAGLLEVRSNGVPPNMIWQRYTPYGVNSNRSYTRSYYAGTWYPWNRSNAESDTDWIDFSLQNSWVNAGGSFGNAGYRVKNGMVFTRGLIKFGVVTNGTLLATIPAAYAPNSTLMYATIAYAGSEQARIDVINDGAIRGQYGLQAGWTSLALPPWPVEN